MQNIDFDTVDDFLDYLPDNERKIVDYLRRIILECIPGCTEKLSYNVPFYYRHARICFIWPSSVPWGKVKAGVQLGFCNGNLLQDELNYLDKGGRKQVYSKTFTDIKAIDVDLLKTYIFDAVKVDKQLKKKK
ncbi:DUF1801 domain-containing protein [Galbibacter sp. EGI 63066]|uniref:DUF1801 domain-containing protein n=1 Tax=Galbibacter sp. EGI 63066 TaxID=2993559 RepID=UPI00224904B7|nr:DUF1801 domain-containing protein [Galbibacter sp. EGI 63066]MCX2681473.1 DUF1801 domain-containing protein [Galbibacter sp. EGI 63066]